MRNPKKRDRRIVVNSFAVSRPALRYALLMRYITRTLLLLSLCATFASGTAHAQQQNTVYRYCYVGKPPYGAVVFFSEAFAVDIGVYNVGIQNAFHSYVSARHDPDTMAGGQCMGPYDSRREAEDALNDHIAESRRDGKQVVLTWWRYSGG